MYGKENDGTITKVIVTMLIIVLVLMVGYSVYKVEHSEVIPKENKVKVLKVEGWEENTNTIEIDGEKIEFILDASGSNTDVDYKVTLSLNDENIKLYTDEYHLYESQNVLTGTIQYKETMKKTIVLYVEKNDDNIIESSDEENVFSTLNVKVEIAKN